MWQLRFDAAKGVERAFRSLLDADDIDDCSVESDSLRIRFTAGVERGELLVAAIYEMGALCWCSRHRVHEGGASGEKPRHDLAV